MKHLFSLLLFIGIITTSDAQDHKWEFGLLLGGSNIGGDLIDPDLSTFKETNFAIGLQAKKIINKTFGIRLGYYTGTLTGEDRNFERLSYRGFSSSTPLHEFSGMAEWDILGHKRYKGEQFKKTFSPYILGGLGLTHFNPKVDFGNGTASNSEMVAVDQAADVSTFRVVVPVGAGVKMDLNPQWSLGLEYAFRITFSDYLDGVSMSGNPDKNDWYGIGGLNLNYRMSKRDTDKDGVADAQDECPEEYGILSLNGCPDGDMDGIADAEDNCPALAGIALYGGCPDTDGDGILDPYDDCPETSGLRERSGCPIFDGDSDGIEDEDDPCPTVAGPADNQGCPYPDTDQDGILDKDDLCPTIAGLKDMDGCPDSDGDGIVDIKDDCPKILGTLSNKGCPEISAKEVEAVTFATQSVQFETAKYVLKASSHATLNEIAEILEKYPQYDLMIKGYTDDRGDRVANRKLSENRAFACMQYFSAKGITARRLSYKGFGESDPIASNSTAKGRSQNRRVTFELVMDDKVITSGR
ncbi:MAG: OmpA family protein [Saprospiraceae bacterium]|nr:OmpA family protein [Saprospiraceae bacterium]